jgi:hypothetical protein
MSRSDSNEGFARSHRSRRLFLKEVAAGVLISATAHPIAAAQPVEDFTAASPLIKSVRYLGEQFRKNPVGITGADGATSTVLPSGESLWMFGDTVEGPFKTIRGLDLTALRSNTGAIVPHQDASDGIKSFHFLADSSHRPRQVVPFLPNEDPAVARIWAIHGFARENSVYLFYHRISLMPGIDVFANFKLEGMGIAKAVVPKLQFERLTAPDGTHEFWKGDLPTFGVFVVREPDFIYLWGSLATGMHLARTTPDGFEDLSTYEYLVEAPTIARPNTAPRWAREFQPTGMLFDSVPNEMSASFNSHLKKYVAIHSFQRENRIVMRTADSITGPWSEPELIYRPKLATADELIYAAKEHPELAREGGRQLYITYVSSATYIPQMIEVTLR